MDPSNDKGNIDSLVESCLRTGLKLHDNIPNEHSFVTNKQGETFVTDPISFYRLATAIFELIVTYRGEPNDYSNLGCSQAFLGRDSKNEREKIQLFKDAIHNLELALEGGLNSSQTYHFLGGSQSRLANLSKDEMEKIPLYQKAIDNLKKAAKIEKNPSIYYELGDAQRDLAPFLPLEEKVGLYKEAISNLTEAVKLRGWSNGYYLLGMTQSVLADCLFEQIEIKELRQQAITHLRKSYELDKDPVTLGKIHGIEASIF